MRTPRTRAQMLSLLLLTAAVCCVGQAHSAQTAPQPMRPLFQENPTSPEDLAAQTRSFATPDIRTVLDACAAILDDMGYTRVESSRTLGVVSAMREADVPPPGAGHAVAEAAVVTLSLLASMIIGEDMVTDLPEQTSQVIYLSILVAPDGTNPGRTLVRASIDRDLVYDRDRGIRPDHTELPRVYEEFFHNLARTIFLEAQAL